MLLVTAASQVGLLSWGLAALPAQAQPMEYVRVCDIFGTGYYYTPGAESCADASIMGYRVNTEIGGMSNANGGATVGRGGFTGAPMPEAYGQSAPAGNNSAFGTNAWAGGDPNSGIAMYPPMDPSHEDYRGWEHVYRQLYEHYDGVLPREEIVFELEDPGEPGDLGYNEDYADIYEDMDGVFEGDFTNRFYRPGSAFNNVNTTAIGTGAQAGAGAAGQDNATAVGQDARANALNATAIGQGSRATAVNSVALGRGSVADEENTVSVGASGAERRIVNVAAGDVTSTSTDAVVGSQLHGLASDVADALGGGAAVGADGAWTAPTYAVQGSDYDNVGEALGALDAQVTTNTTAIGDLETDVEDLQSDVGDLQTDVGNLQTDVADLQTDVGDLQTDVSDLQTSVGTLQTTVEGHGAAIGELETDVAANTAAIGELETDVSGLTATVGTQGAAITNLQSGQTAATGRIADLEDGLADGTIGLVQQDQAGRGLTVGADTDGDTVDFAGTDGPRRLTGLAAGVMGSDAVTLEQMQQAISLAGPQMGDAPDGMDGAEATGEGSYASGYGSKAEGDDTTAIGTGAQATYEGATAIGAGARATADPTTAVGFFSAATGNNGSAFGGLAEASGENSTAIGESSVASATGATALGRGAIASAANSVALGTASVASRGAQSGYEALGLADPQTSVGEVSVGTSGGARQITNVAAGSAATDAVNVSQLAGVRAEALAYTDLAAAVFSEGLSRSVRQAEAGTAAAMAAAGLVQATNPGSSVVSGGVGTWRGASAMAFGVSHRFDNNWTVKAAGSFAEHGGAGMNAAVGFEF